MEPENTSGHGTMSTVPAEIDRWNWGAMLLNWVWGIGNNTWIALLMFVPFANMVMPFVLGAKGSVWAWRNKRWDSIEHFKRVQRLWTIWALVIWLAFFALIAAILVGVGMSLKSSDVFLQAVRHVEANEEARAALGPPISTGFPWGSFEIEGPTGKADFSFDVYGSKSKGTTYVEAIRERGTWRFVLLEIEMDGSSERIDLDP